MIFRRAALHEFGAVALAVFAALFAVTITTQTVRLLGQAAGGVVLSGSVLPLLGFSALNYLPVILSLTVFISVLMGMSRSFRDSEMIAWYTAGAPLSAWVRPVVVFAGPVVALIAILSLSLSPWAAERSDYYRRQLDRRDDLARISPGMFKEGGDAGRVFFVEEVGGDVSEVRNVFVASMHDGQLGILVSRKGYKDVDEIGERRVVLLSGKRYQGTPGGADFRVMDFDRYFLRISSREASAPESQAKTLSTLSLLSEPTSVNLGELVWRLGLPISALILALMAIPLSFVNPRASRSANLLFALIVYMVYSNLLSISQAWVTQGRMSFHYGVTLIHACMLVIFLGLLIGRMKIWSPWRSIR
jgi:lipopolysaccharide export system permease protein